MAAMYETMYSFLPLPLETIDCYRKTPPLCCLINDSWSTGEETVLTEECELLGGEPDCDELELGLLFLNTSSKALLATVTLGN